MDAKCVRCENVAQYYVNDGEVKCPSCGFKATYDEYIELMSGKVEDKAPEYVERESL